jgi:aldehyde decarbonylase
LTQHNRYHSLHHTQFRTNYSLFMPIYDYVYGTMDKSSDTLYEASLKRPEESPDVVHLTHLTTPESIYHLRIGFASLASRPHTSKWYLWLMWPVTYITMVFVSSLELWPYICSREHHFPKAQMAVLVGTKIQYTSKKRSFICRVLLRFGLCFVLVRV